MVVHAGRLLWILVVVLFLTVAVVAWIKLSPQFNPEIAVVAPLNNTCDLRAGSCAVTFPDDSRVTFEITPSHIPVVEWLNLGVYVEGIDTRKVEVDFTGVDMDMGFNRVRLKSINGEKFTGTGMLPVCTRTRMTWEAKVLLHTDAGLFAAPFRFDTFQPHAEIPVRSYAVD